MIVKMPVLYINPEGIFFVFKDELTLEIFLETRPDFQYKYQTCFNGYLNALRIY